MLFLIPSRFRHFALIVLGLGVLVYGLAAATKQAALIGAVVLVYGLGKTAYALRSANQPTSR